MRYPSLVGLAGTEESVLIWGGGQDCFARVAGIGARRTGQQGSTQDETRGNFWELVLLSHHSVEGAGGYSAQAGLSPRPL